jgi:hypothetical protein
MVQNGPDTHGDTRSIQGGPTTAALLLADDSDCTDNRSPLLPIGCAPPPRRWCTSIQSPLATSVNQAAHQLSPRASISFRLHRRSDAARWWSWAGPRASKCRCATPAWLAWILAGLSQLPRL